MTQIQREAKIEAYSAVQRSKIHQLQAEARKYEAAQLIDNADELMDYVLHKAGGDPGKLEVFASLALQLINAEVAIFRSHHMRSQWF